MATNRRDYQREYMKHRAHTVYQIVAANYMDRLERDLGSTMPEPFRTVLIQRLVDGRGRLTSLQEAL